MKYSRCVNFLCLAAVLAIVAIWPAQSYAADPYTYIINSVTNSTPGSIPSVTFSVKNNSTGALADLHTDPAWTTAGVSSLSVRIGWDTRDFNNTNSGPSGGRGAAMPMAVNALTAATPNGDGTYTVVFPGAIPGTASGTGEALMDGHPAGQDSTGAWTVRVPIKSVYTYFLISGSTIVPRRQVVDVNKCMVCHKTDGTGVAPRLTLHGNSRTEEPQVCVVCHNPNQTDIPFRYVNRLVNGVLTSVNPTVVVGSYTYPEQGIDFKRLVHGIHASSAGFRNRPLVVVGFNSTIFDASKLIKFPASLRNCVNCHIDDGRKGTFELQPTSSSGYVSPLPANVLGSTMNTLSENNTPDPITGLFPINTNPDDNVRISPTAAVCSSCHDSSSIISHMVSTGGASFRTSQAAIGVTVRERCNSCHGPGKEESVRKVHLSDD